MKWGPLELSQTTLGSICRLNKGLWTIVAVRTDAGVATAADVSGRLDGVDESVEVVEVRVEVEDVVVAVGERDHADAHPPGVDDVAQLRQQLDEELTDLGVLVEVHRAAGRVQQDDEVRLVTTLGWTKHPRCRTARRRRPTPIDRPHIR